MVPTDTLGRARFTDQQTAEAKKSIYRVKPGKGSRGPQHPHGEPHGDDSVGQPAVAANARLALLAGQYLRNRLDATPGDISSAINSMSKTIEDLGIYYLAGATSFVLDPLRNDLNNETGQIDAMCA